MATVQGSLVEATGAAVIQPRYNLNCVCYVATYTVPASLATADVIQMCKVAAGFKFIDATLASNAAVGVAAGLGLGDGNSTTRFMPNNTGYTAALAVRASIAAGFGYTYTVDDTIDVLCGTITTPTAGTVITLTLIGTYL